MAINFAVQEKPSFAATALAVVLGCALTSGLLFIAAVIGPVAAVLHLVIAFPLAYVGMRYGTLAALLGLAATAAVQNVSAGLLPASIYLMQFGAASVVLPMLLRSGISWFRSVALALALTALLVCLGAQGYALKHDTSIPALVAGYIDGEVAAARQMYEAAEIPQDQLRDLMLVLDTTAQFFHQAYVGLALTAFGVMLVMTVGLLKVAPRRNYAVPGDLFHHMKVPEGMIWLLISAGFALLTKVPVIQQVALNILTVLLPLYFLHGMAIITFFFKKKAFSTMSRVFGYLLILVINPLPLLVTAMGVFDMWFDFRKPRIKTT